MIEENPPPDLPTTKQPWKEAGFFLSLLAVLFWGLAGLIGAATSFICLKILEPKTSRRLAMAAAIAIGTLALIAAEKFLPR
jgi:hypothetical protein